MLDRDVECARLYLRGATLKQLAERYGVSKQRVAQILDSARIERRPQGRPRKAKANG